MVQTYDTLKYVCYSIIVSRHAVPRVDLSSGVGKCVRTYRERLYGEIVTCAMSQRISFSVVNRMPD